jgi:hypothetical protein
LTGGQILLLGASVVLVTGTRSVPSREEITMTIGTRIVVGAAAAAFFVPLSAGSAHAAGDGRVPGPVYGPTITSPTLIAGYSPVCEAGYQAGKSVLDPVMQLGPGWASTAETALCGRQRHS